MDNREIDHTSIVDIKRFPYVSGFDFTKPGMHLQKNSNHFFVPTKCISTPTLKRHFEGEQTLSLYRYPHSKMVMIDVDQRNQKKGVSTKEVVEKLVDHLGRPFYLEYSSTSGGYHVYFIYKDYIYDNALAYLESYFKKVYGYLIEPIFNNKTLRLPLSKTYLHAGTYHKHRKHLIDTSSITSIADLVKIFGSAKELSIPTIFHGKNICGDVPERSEGYDSSIANVVVSSKPSTKDFSYGAGERISAQINIAFHVLNFGGDVNDYIRLCEKYDYGSKDMQIRPLDKRDKYISSIFYWALKQYKQGVGSSYPLASRDYLQQNKEYRYNPHVGIPPKTWIKLEKILTFYVKAYALCSEKYVKTFVTNTIRLFEHMYQKYRYDKKRPDKYVDENLLSLNEGFLFNKELRTSIARTYDIKNPDRCMKLLREAGIVSVLTSKDGFTHSWKGKTRWAYHYSINFGVIESLSKKIDQFHNTYKKLKSKDNENDDSITHSPHPYISRPPMDYYKLYNKLLHDEILNTSFSFDEMQEIMAYRPPPLSLGGFTLRQRLHHIDKRLNG